jgi:hypothetical protein
MPFAPIERTLVVPGIGESQNESVCRAMGSRTVRFHSKRGDVDVVRHGLFEFLARNEEQAVARIEVQDKFAGCNRNAFIHRIIDTSVGFADPVINRVAVPAEDIESSIIRAPIDDNQLSIFSPPRHNVFQQWGQFVRRAKHDRYNRDERRRKARSLAQP